MNNKTIIFTDGASRGNPGPGGWGAIVVEGEKVFEFGGREDKTTNNRMELTAAIEALSKVKGQSLIVIYSDSSYVINGITKWIYSWEKRNWVTQNKEPVLNKDLWEKLLEATKLKKIEWKHVKGHSGISGNERADEIATSFADGNDFNLYSGSLSEYKKLEKTSESKAGKAYYLSFVDGVIKKHKTWAECEKRVKGKSKAKFKKVFSKSEEEKVKKDWLG